MEQGMYIPKQSMYAICAYIYHQFKRNVGNYTITWMIWDIFFVFFEFLALVSQDQIVAGRSGWFPRGSLHPEFSSNLLQVGCCFLLVYSKR